MVITEGQDAAFVFADIAGFTALTEATATKRLPELVAEFCAAVSAELGRQQPWTCLTLALLVVAIFFMTAKPFA